MESAGYIALVVVATIAGYLFGKNEGETIGFIKAMKKKSRIEENLLDALEMLKKLNKEIN